MTYMLIATIFSTTPSQMEARVIDAQARVERHVNPFEFEDLEPFIDMETPAQKLYKE